VLTIASFQVYMSDSSHQISSGKNNQVLSDRELVDVARWYMNKKDEEELPVTTEKPEKKPVKIKHKDYWNKLDDGEPLQELEDDFGDGFDDKADLKSIHEKPKPNSVESLGKLSFKLADNKPGKKKKFYRDNGIHNSSVINQAKNGRVVVDTNALKHKRKDRHKHFTYEKDPLIEPREEFDPDSSYKIATKKRNQKFNYQISDLLSVVRNVPDTRPQE